MTDEQIIKALRYCNGVDCENCKALDFCDYQHAGRLARCAYVVIRRQQAKIEREINQIKSEAIKEFIANIGKAIITVIPARNAVWAKAKHPTKMIFAVTEKGKKMNINNNIEITYPHSAVDMKNCNRQIAIMKGELINIILDNGAKMPNRAHDTDAGLDLFSCETKVIPARGSAIFDTGVHIELPPNTVGFLKSKSGLNVKYGILSEGVIDVGYTGSIVAKLYNNSDTDYEVKKGDKITQLVILPILTPKLNLVTEFDKTDRDTDGFGSTGR